MLFAALGLRGVGVHVAKFHEQPDAARTAVGFSVPGDASRVLSSLVPPKDAAAFNKGMDEYQARMTTALAELERYANG
jgi:hypothetical protein